MTISWIISESPVARAGLQVGDLLLRFDGKPVARSVEAFAHANVVSNHIANLPQTVKLLREEHFAAMKTGATFINTGRGATVDEDGLIRVLQARFDLTALLDVTHPEPPLEDSPLYSLPNAQLSSHIAGSLGDEVVRMADSVIEESARWQRGEPLRYAVTPEMLDTMA